MQNIYGNLFYIVGLLFIIVDVVKIVLMQRNKTTENHLLEVQETLQETQAEVQEIERQVLKQGYTAMLNEGKLAGMTCTGQSIPLQLLYVHAEEQAERYANRFPCAEVNYCAALAKAWQKGFVETYKPMEESQQPQTTGQARIVPNRDNTPRRTDDLDEPTQQTRSMHRVRQ